MLDIFIKSFNRPYYLDRAIKSIKKNISGCYNIIVLDDGTPRKYLAKLKKLYPDISILYSLQANLKAREIEAYIKSDVPIKTKGIPYKLWTNSIRNASDYFLLLTDDTWVYNMINLEMIIPVLRTNKVNILKFLWLGNPNLIQSEQTTLIIPSIERITPVISNNPLQLFCYKHLLNNTIRVSGLLKYLGLINKDYRHKFYSLYTVGGAIFHRDYWLYLWQSAESKVNENQQLIKALSWYKMNPDTIYAKAETECMRTSFSSSATNMFPNIELNPYALNHYLNEAWYYDKLDSMGNFPKDFTIESILEILKDAGDARCKPENWLAWVDKFRSIYKVQGCDVN